MTEFDCLVHFKVKTIMWYAPEGEMTFSGPYGLMLANGIRSLVDELMTSTEYDDPYEIGCKAFDLMTEEQKVWTLHKVAFGLLDEKNSEMRTVRLY